MSFVSIIILVTSILVLVVSYNLFFKSNNRLLKAALFFVVIFLLLLGFTLYNGIIELSKIEDYSNLGSSGDYIGGLLNPLIAVFAVFAAGFAFYAQYDANKLVQEQFTLQQFESQFYEMLHLHRENLNEMIIEGYSFEYIDDDKSKEGVHNSKKEKNTSGKKVFVTMLKEFEAVYFICQKIFFSHYKSQPEKISLLESNVGSQLIFANAYNCFFNGTSLYEKKIKKHLKDDSTELLSEDLIDKLIKELKRKREGHTKGIKKITGYGLIKNLKTNKKIKNELMLSFNFKPFTGHQAILAHYYRHLYQTVKFVVKQNESIVSYESKRDYLRILRSMLSNHEQILLYYNWIAGFGEGWEEKKIENRKTKKGNFFLTDYRMIHNIPDEMILDDFKLNKIFTDEYLYFRYEKNRKAKDSLFELINITSRSW
jgi:hypothetical protein